MSCFVSDYVWLEVFGKVSRGGSGGRCKPALQVGLFLKGAYLTFFRYSFFQIITFPSKLQPKRHLNIPQTSVGGLFQVLFLRI